MSYLGRVCYKVLVCGSRPKSPEFLCRETWNLVPWYKGLHFYQESVGKSDRGYLPGRTSAGSESLCLHLTRSEFLNFSTVGTWGWEVLCGGVCPVQWTMYGSIRGLYPPPRDASGTSRNPKETRLSPDSATCPPGDKNQALAENHWIKMMYNHLSKWLPQFMCSPEMHRWSHCSIFLPACLWADCLTIVPIRWE